MRLLLLNPSWRGRRRACPGNEAEPDCGPDRATEKQAGLGEGYEGDSPRLGMIQSMETLGVQLLGGYAAERAVRVPTARKTGIIFHPDWASVTAGKCTGLAV